jgi:glucosylceramidase
MTVIAVAGLVALQQPAYAASTVTVNGASVQQKVDGFGFSQAFGRTSTIRSLSAQNQQKVLDLLLSPSTGAGLSILRLGIDTESHLIQASDPGGPNAAPKYSWDGDDGGQVWLAQKAKSYGVNRFYADSWSAPAYMKTNNSLANGGAICGTPGAGCNGGDWRKAYANYLVQYAKYYAQEGIPITDLGFTNEPNWTTDYASMQMSPAQVADMAAVAGPIVTGAGYKLNCCDAVGWASEQDYSKAVVANSTANQYVSTHTGHSYGSYPTTPLASGGKPTWMSEWSPDGSAWNAAWDDGSASSGLSVAQAIHNAFTGGNVSGFVYWYGVSTGGTRAFIQGNGANYTVSKRLWAMASYSRYVRPGATRIAASTSDSTLKTSAYRNTDGSVVVVALNTATSASPVTYSLQNTGITSGSAAPYLTNSANDMSAQSPAPVSAGAFSATVPARSLVTYKITGGGTTTPTTPPATASPTPTPSGAPQPGTGSCQVGYSTSPWSTGLTAAITIKNTGTSAINGWSLGFTLPAGQAITSGWNATYTPSSGAVTATNLSYDAEIAPGASVSIGFQADHTGNTSAPKTFILNGSACTT